MSRTEIGPNAHIQDDDDMRRKSRALVAFISVVSVLSLFLLMLLVMGAGCPDPALYRTAAGPIEKMSRNRQPPPTCNDKCKAEGEEMGFTGMRCTSTTNGICACGGGTSIRGTFPVKCD